MLCSEVPNKLINLKLTLPLKEWLLKSSTGGVWNSNGVAQCTQEESFISRQPLMNTTCKPIFSSTDICAVSINVENFMDVEFALYICLFFFKVAFQFGYNGAQSDL